MGETYILFQVKHTHDCILTIKLFVYKYDIYVSIISTVDTGNALFTNTICTIQAQYGCKHN